MAKPYRQINSKWLRYIGCGEYRFTRLYLCGPCEIRPPKRVRSAIGSVDVNGCIYIMPGFSFSPTGPVPDTDEIVLASGAHDFLYTLGNQGLFPKGWRAKADAFLRKQMKDGADNVAEKAYAYIAWAGVRTLYWPMVGLKKLWGWITP